MNKLNSFSLNWRMYLTNVAKLDIKLRHGVVCSKFGYVLPFKRRWVVRMLVEHPLAVDYDDDDD